MKKLAGVVIALALCTGSLHAASGPTTQGDFLRNWFKIYSKDFKKIKSKDLLVSASPLADRMLDGLEATGLQTGSTIFSTLPTELQTALTRLKTDLQTFRTKISDTKSRIGRVVRDLRLAAATGTPPQLDTAQVLVSAMFDALADGEIASKEAEVINAATNTLAGTAGLDPTMAATLRTDAAAVLSGANATDSDLALLKTDLSTIATLLKALP